MFLVFISLHKTSVLLEAFTYPVFESRNLKVSPVNVENLHCVPFDSEEQIPAVFRVHICLPYMMALRLKLPLAI